MVSQRQLRRLTAVVTSALLFAGTAAAEASAAAPAPTKPYTAAGCSSPGKGPQGKLLARCYALVKTATTRKAATPNDAVPPPGALGPADIKDAYQLPAGGQSQTVAIVDAGDDANAEADLAVFRSQYGLPACTTDNGCFQKVNQNGEQANYPFDFGWGTEISLDLDAVSAACPACHILLVESDDNTIDNLGAAVDTAVALGAKYVSNSYGVLGEDPNEPNLDHFYNHPGVAVAAATGDTGNVTNWPATNPNVIGVGGTSLARDSSARGWHETAWSDGGSGCSPYEPHPDYQNGITTDCPNNRAIADIAADADPQSGLAVYDTNTNDPTINCGGWCEVGGTSLATPLVTAMYALAGTPAPNTNPVTYPYLDPNRTSDLFDITEGTDGGCGSVLCIAGPGWDGPTGLGTPNGVAALSGGPRGDIAGTVTDADTGKPVAAATVSTQDGHTTRSDANGHYDLGLSPGSYDVTAMAFGHADKTATGIQVTDGQTTTVDFSLAGLPSTTLSGTVTDGSGHGWPLYARISVAGDPDGPSFTNPITGHFSIQLPANTSYNVTFQSQLPGYQTLHQNITLGDSDMTHDVAIPVTGDCTAPGYQLDNATPVLDEHFDSGGLPSSWTIDDNAGGGAVWRFDDPGGRGNNTGGQGGFAIEDSDHYGGGNTEDSSLVSPAIDLSNVRAPVLRFHNDYFGFPGQTGDVDLSTDGGRTWSNTWRHQSDSVRGPDLEQRAIPDAAGQANVKIRFHFISNFGWWWQVDDVSVLNVSCDPTPGGLVEGNISDLTTGDPINQATVRSDDKATETANTFATPDDPNNPGGFYWLFSSLTGSHPFTAERPGFGALTRAVDVAPNAVVRQDFALGTGRLTVSPGSLNAKVEIGTNATAQLSITNTGTGAATYDIAERATTSGTASARPAANPAVQRFPGHYAPDEPAKATTKGKPAEGAAAAASGSSWQPVSDYPTPIADNAAATAPDGQVYSVGGSDGFGDVAAGYRYDPAVNHWSPIASMSTSRDRPAAAFLGGKLYVAGGWLGADPTASMEIYDPATNTWSAGASMPHGSAAATAVAADGALYMIGGVGTSGSGQYFSDVFRYDPASDRWTAVADYPVPTSWTQCGNIDELIYCAGGANAEGNLTSAYVYDPLTDTWTPIANLPQDRWGGAYGSQSGHLVISGGVVDNAVTNTGVSYDPRTDSWTPIENSTTALYRGGGACGLYKIGGQQPPNFVVTQSAEQNPNLGTCGPSFTDVPWLQEDPATATIGPGQTRTVTVHLDTTVAATAQPGTFTASLVVREDTPSPGAEIPVTLTTVPPANWGRVEGTVSDLGHCNAGDSPLPGATVLLHGKQSDITLHTGADGGFSYWLDRRNAPLTLQVSRDGYVTASQPGVPVVPGDATVRNVKLGRDAPCATTGTSALRVTVPAGGRTTTNLQLQNPGTAGYKYAIGKGPGLAPPAGGSAPGWSDGAAMPTDDSDFGYTQCPGDSTTFYVFGGRTNDNAAVDTAWRYDARANTWTVLAPMPDILAETAATCIDGRIHLLGGNQDTALGTTVHYVYDIATDSWSTAAPTPRPVLYAKAGSWNGRIYLIGGEPTPFPGGTSNEVDVYNVATDSWVVTAAPMPAAAAAAGSAQIGPFVYLAGGWDDNAPGINVAATQRLDLSTGTWSVGPKLNSPRGDLALVATNTALYAVGGDADRQLFTEPTDTVERLAYVDWETGGWHQLADGLPLLTMANGAFCTADGGGDAAVWSVGGGVQFVTPGITDRSVFERVAGERCMTPAGDVSWLAAQPSTGTVPAGGRSKVSVTVDATGLATGVYRATLIITTNDPAAVELLVPIQVTVKPAD